MERLSSSDSMGGRECQRMLDGYEEEANVVEEYSGNGHVGVSEKKRRLSVDQVKALEKNFEVENKLEPERKVKLAQELGLQPRQVAVWFQNRRARWKTKQLEKDYGVLKAQYDALRLSYDNLRRDNTALLQQIAKIKAKIKGEEDNTATESDISVPPERNHHETLEQTEPSSPPMLLEHSEDLNYRSFTDLRDLLPQAAASTSAAAATVAAGSSDSSESSAVVNEESSSSARLTPPAAFSDGNFFRFVKMEETEEHDDFLSGEEACGFFSDEQPPYLHWYSAADHWT